MTVSTRPDTLFQRMQVRISRDLGPLDSDLWRSEANIDTRFCRSEELR